MSTRNSEAIDMPHLENHERDLELVEGDCPQPPRYHRKVGLAQVGQGRVAHEIAQDDDDANHQHHPRKRHDHHLIFKDGESGGSKHDKARKNNPGEKKEVSSVDELCQMQVHIAKHARCDPPCTYLSSNGRHEDRSGELRSKKTTKIEIICITIFDFLSGCSSCLSLSHHPRTVGAVAGVARVADSPRVTLRADRAIFDVVMIMIMTSSGKPGQGSERVGWGRVESSRSAPHQKWL